MTRSEGFRRPTRARLCLLALALTIGTSGIATAGHYDDNPATGSFAPGFGIHADNPVADSLSGLTFRVTQRDHEDVIRSYRIAVPAGWRFAAGSVDASSLASCRDVNSTNLMTKMEALGPARIVLQTNTTRDPNPNPLQPFTAPGPATYLGGLWFLRWDPASSTATFCGFVTRKTGRVTPGTPSDIVFGVSLRFLADTSWELSFDLAAAPEALPGDRSITDNGAFQREEVSVLEVMLQIQGATYGNFNKDPAGEKASVAFSRAPATPGSYTVTGTFTPCPSDEPASKCDSGASPVVSKDSVQITTQPSGYHPAPKITEPIRFAVVTGTSAPVVRWTQPATAPLDAIRGYVLTVQPTNKPEASHVRYLVTDPEAQGYLASADPCAPGGSAPTCSLPLEFPLSTASSGLLPVNGQYLAKLVTLFRDRHRSDGRCDDGTAAGALPPCADGSTPAFAAPGVASTDFLLRSRPWPLAYRQCISGNRGIHQVHVLLADLDQQAFEFTSWLPLPVVYGTSTLGVVGTNSAGGAIAHLDLGYSGRFGIQATLTTTTAVALVERMGSTAPTPVGGLVTPTETFMFTGQRPVAPC